MSDELAKTAQQILSNRAGKFVTVVSSEDGAIAVAMRGAGTIAARRFKRGGEIENLPPATVTNG